MHHPDWVSLNLTLEFLLQEVAQPLTQKVKIGRLVEEMKYAITIKELHVGSSDRSAVDHNWNMPEFCILLDSRDKFFPVHLRKIDVKENNIRILRKIYKFCQAFITI